MGAVERKRSIDSEIITYLYVILGTYVYDHQYDRNLWEKGWALLRCFRKSRID